MSRAPTHLTSAMTGLELRNLVILNNSWGDKADEKIKICFLASQEKPGGVQMARVSGHSNLKESNVEKKSKVCVRGGKGDQVDGP